MRIHLVQLDIEWENPAANRERAARLIGETAIAPGDLVLLPEMFDTGFSFDVARTADRSGESRALLAELARSHHAFVLGGVTVIDEQGRARNRAVVAAPSGATIAAYDKCRLFPLGSPSEADSLTPGTKTTTFDWQGPAGGLSVCPLICYDLRFPELFQRGLTGGAEAFAVIANWPIDRAAHWRALLVARAIECQAFIFAVNRAGSDPKLTYGGGSMVISPLGTPLGEADGLEQVLSVEVSRPALDDWRGRFPAWKARMRSGEVP